MPPIATSGIAALLWLVLAPTVPADEVHWGYGTEHAPSQWSEVKPEFEISFPP
jgi:carbonic anhydrase